MQGAGTLQAKRKSNHWYEIKPVQEKNVRKKISKVHFVWFKATTKTKPVPESLLVEL